VGLQIDTTVHFLVFLLRLVFNLGDFASADFNGLQLDNGSTLNQGRSHIEFRKSFTLSLYLASGPPIDSHKTGKYKLLIAVKMHQNLRRRISKINFLSHTGEGFRQTQSP